MKSPSRVMFAYPAILTLALTLTACGGGGGGGNAGGGLPTPPAASSGLRVLVLRKDAGGRVVPAAGVEVVRHDAGFAAADRRITDAQGTADFGDIGADHATLSLLPAPWTEADGRTATATVTLLDVPAGNIVLRLDKLDPLLHAAMPAPGTSFDVEVSVADPAFHTSLRLPTKVVEGTGSFTSVGLAPSDVAADATVSMIAEAGDDGELVACGALLDGPVPSPGSRNVLSADQAPGSTLITSGMELRGVWVRHKDLDFELTLDRRGGSSCANLFPSSARIGLTGAKFLSQTVRTVGNFTVETTPEERVTAVSSGLPQSAVLSEAGFVFDSIVHEPAGELLGLVEWTLSAPARASADLVVVRLRWEGGGETSSWTVYAPPGAGRVAVGSLRAALGSRAAVPYAGTVEVEALDFDDRSGYAELWRQVSERQGDLRAVWMAAGTIRSAFAWLRAFREGGGGGVVFLTVDHELRSSFRFGRVLGPDGIDCGPACSGTFGHGEVVELRAVPNAGARFGRWGGDCQPSQDNLVATLVMDGDKFCTALFGSSDPGRLVSLTVAVVGLGLVRSDDGSISCGLDAEGVPHSRCSAFLPLGYELGLAVRPSGPPGTAFDVRWIGDCEGTTAFTSVVMDQDKSCTAELTPR
ncbi:MAG TPA: hypothetical protein VNM66_08160 [Thermodesulfobacteriota bacterium]|nr:hypothetical protein [Thermodesulfobacteriota bacterium]